MSSASTFYLGRQIALEAQVIDVSRVLVLQSCTYNRYLDLKAQPSAWHFGWAPDVMVHAVTTTTCSSNVLMDTVRIPAPQSSA